jgi:hypothetical protein
MNKLILKLLAVLILLTALIVTPGWVKDLSEEPKKNTDTSSDQKITGKSLEISNTGYYSFKLATISYAQFY